MHRIIITRMSCPIESYSGLLVFCVLTSYTHKKTPRKWERPRETERQWETVRESDRQRTYERPCSKSYYSQGADEKAQTSSEHIAIFLRCSIKLCTMNSLSATFTVFSFLFGYTCGTYCKLWPFLFFSFCHLPVILKKTTNALGWSTKSHLHNLRQ